MQFSRKNKKCSAKMFTISYKLKHTKRVVREAATICNITTKKKHSLEKKNEKIQLVYTRDADLCFMGLCEDKKKNFLKVIKRLYKTGLDKTLKII